MTPHRVHLLEMRASRPGATAGDECAATVAEIMRVRDNALDTLDAIDSPPTDATARHLAEMRHGNKEH